MSVSQHISEHSVAYLVAAALSAIGFLVWVGAMAYMDLRHITRVDWVQEQINETEDEIQRLTLYNEFGTEGNKPARDQVIIQLENKKSRLVRELDEIKDN